MFLASALEQTRQHVLQVDVHLFNRRTRDDLERGKRLLAHVDLDRAAVEPARAQLLAEVLARSRLLIPGRALVFVRRDRTRWRQQNVEQTILGVLLRFRAHFFEPFGPDHLHTELDQVTHHRLYVSADVADFRELRRLDLEER
jgi:hypothetical protein